MTNQPKPSSCHKKPWQRTGWDFGPGDILGPNERASKLQNVVLSANSLVTVIYLNELALKRKLINFGLFVLATIDGVFFSNHFPFSLTKMCTEKIFKIFQRSELLQFFSLFVFNRLRVWFKSKGPEEMDRIHQNHFGCDPGVAKRQKSNGFAWIWGSFCWWASFFFFFSGALAWVGCRLDGLDRLGFLFFPRFFPKLQKVEVKERKTLKQKEGGKSTGRS